MLLMQHLPEAFFVRIAPYFGIWRRPLVLSRGLVKRLVGQVCKGTNADSSSHFSCMAIIFERSKIFLDLLFLVADDFVGVVRSLLARRRY